MGLITRQEFEEFEREYVLLVIKNPSYRYGQHFMNTFRDIQMDINEDYNNGVITYDLWNERDPARAREWCLKYVSKD